MKVAFRAVAVSVMLSLAWAGPLAPLANAQQPSAGVDVAQTTTTPPAAPAPAQPAAPTAMFQEQMRPVPEPRKTDAYDVGAVAATAFSLPFKAAICGLGFATSVIVLAGTFGARPDASAEVLNEACGPRQRWIVRGSDLRPRPSTARAFDWETHRFEWEQR
jgi:hypothetical protein